MEKTFNATQFAKDSARDAMDQAAEYGGIEKSAEAYRTNLADTLVECGCLDVEEFNAALRVFEHALSQISGARR